MFAKDIPENLPAFAVVLRIAAQNKNESQDRVGLGLEMIEGLAQWLRDVGLSSRRAAVLYKWGKLAEAYF